MSPPGSSCTIQAYTQHRRERQVSSRSGARLRPGLRGLWAIDNFRGDVGVQVSCRKGLTLELCQLQQSYSSVNQGAMFKRSDRTDIMMHPGLEVSVCKVIFYLGFSWGNSDRLGWKSQVFLTLKPCKTRCQEQRCSFPSDAAMSMPNRSWWEALGSRGLKL